MDRISDNLYRYCDTCNVYIIRYGRDCVLVDFGAGDVLEHLAEIGVERVTDVLMTHHHRDQGQGLARAAAAGSRIWVPAAEQDLFAGVEAHWQARPVYNDYNMRQDRFSVLEPVAIAGTLRDYDSLRFGDLSLTVVPTPGHTTGSASLLGEIDGQRVAFSGDLIAAPGKLWSLAATQWTYNQAEGAAASIASLLDLQRRAPALLLPSHGEPMGSPAVAIDLLVARLTELLAYRHENEHLAEWLAQPYLPVTPHVLWNRTSQAYSYVLLSASGKALFVDFGYDLMTGFAAGADRASRRPWLYTLPVLKRDFGVRMIDVVIPTHYHDDHVAGCNLLRTAEGARIWAPVEFAAILADPAAYDLPCLWYDPVLPDRVLPPGEPVLWEEYVLRLYPQRGHTRYAAAITFEADGRRFLCSGDQYADEGLEAWNYVYRNHFAPTDYRQVAELYGRLRPDVILSGHWQPYWVQPGYFERLAEKGEALERLHHALLPLDAYACDAEGGVAVLRPYQASVRAGEEFELVAELTNPLALEAEMAARLVAPPGWQVDGEVRLRLPAHAAARIPLRLIPPSGLRVRRARVAVDLTVAGRRLGQQAEALIDVC